MSERLCRAPGCTRPAPLGKGTLCPAHRHRLTKHGSFDGRPLGRPRTAPEERFFSRVDFGERTHDGTRCLLWTGAINRGYGSFSLGGRSVTVGKVVRAHRWLYERWFGPIPEGLQLDHLCHDPDVCPGGDGCPHRACVNPLHLRPSTARENVLRSNSLQAQNARKTHCVHGHEFTPENTGTDRRGNRRCLACTTRGKTRVAS